MILMKYSFQRVCGFDCIKRLEVGINEIWIFKARHTRVACSLPCPLRLEAESSSTGRSPTQECRDSGPECRNTAEEKASGYLPQHSY